MESRVEWLVAIAAKLASSYMHKPCACAEGYQANKLHNTFSLCRRKPLLSVSNLVLSSGFR